MAADSSPDLSKQELADALGKRVKSACPICGGRTWDVPSDLKVVFPTQDSLAGFMEFTRRDDANFEFTGVIALPMVCRECGFIASFQYSNLLEDREH